MSLWGKNDDGTIIMASVVIKDEQVLQVQHVTGFARNTTTELQNARHHIWFIIASI
jgi:hypothetical protein